LIDKDKSIVDLKLKKELIELANTAPVFDAKGYNPLDNYVGEDTNIQVMTIKTE
jgi:hypothetical protein